MWQFHVSPSYSNNDDIIYSEIIELPSHFLGILLSERGFARIKIKGNASNPYLIERSRLS